MSEEELQPAEQSVEPEQGSESAPDSEGQHEEKVTFSEEQQAKIDQIIGEQTQKRRQAEREAQAKLEAQARELEALKAKVPEQTRPDIPPIPDPYDDDYEDRIKERDEAIRKVSEFEAAQERQREYESLRQQERQAEQAKSLQQAAESYAERAKTLGIPAEELQAAGQIVNSFGISDSVAQDILNDEIGPQITKYLSQHPTELDALVSESSEFRAGKLYTAIRSKAAALSAKTSDAPPPVEPLQGGGMPRKERGPEGLVIE